MQTQACVKDEADKGLLGAAVAFESITIGAREDDGQDVTISASTLLRHVVCLGSSGSGKTVASKVISEECARQGIPVIAIDPQGDIASLVSTLSEEAAAKHNVSPELRQAYDNDVEVVIFTPASDAGLPICVNPLSADLKKLNLSQRTRALTSMAQIVASLLGYKLDNDDGEAVVAALNYCLERFSRSKKPVGDLQTLSKRLGDMPEDMAREVRALISDRQLDDARRKLARLHVGATRLLFQFGVPLEIDTLLGKDDTATPGKTRISVIYLNTLVSQEDKEFFVAAVAERLYAWMLENPSKTPQALFYIDEVAPYLPPVAKPSCKPVLKLLFKQARKYGVSCLMATQNPGDLDYKSLSQFSTWLLGRLLTKQDIKKIDGIVQSLAPEHVAEVLAQLPSLQPGKFRLLSPDEYDHPVAVKVRWLLTKHETLEEEGLIDLMDSDLSERLLAKASDAQASEEDGEAEEASPEPETKPEQAPEPKASSDPLVQLLSSEGRALTSAEVAEAGGESKDAVRKRLEKLVSEGCLLKHKSGKHNVYFTEDAGLLPEFELMEALPAVQPRIRPEQVIELSELIETSFFGKAMEDFAGAELFHYPLLRLKFEEKVTKARTLGFIGGGEESVQDSIYIDPKSGAFVCFTLDEGFTLAHDPGTNYASEIEDLDGYSQFEKTRPLDLSLRKQDFSGKVSVEGATKVLKQRYSVSPHETSLIVVPYYEVKLKHRKTGETRTLLVDALSGNEFSTAPVDVSSK